MARVKQAPGRYSLHGARAPANGFGRPAAPSLNRRVRTAVVAVADPNPDPTGPRTERVQAVAVLDLLDKELREGGITDAQYLVGREIQRAYERARRGPAGPGMWRTAGRVDGGTKDCPVASAMEVAERLDEVKAKIDDVIGWSGVKFLEHFLVEGIGFARYAEKVGRPGRAGTASVASYFRTQLENVAAGWGQKPNDKAPMRGWTAEET